MGGVVRDPLGRKEVRALSECCPAGIIKAGLEKAVGWGQLSPKSEANLQKWAGLNPKQAQKLSCFQEAEILKIKLYKSQQCRPHYLGLRELLIA